jgi:phage FluMu gp28-like protein
MISNNQSQLPVDKVVRKIPYVFDIDKMRDVKREAKDIHISNNFIVDVCDTFRLKGRSPIAIIYKEPTEAELTDWLSTNSGYIQSTFSYDGVPFILEDYQERWIDDDSKFKWCGKSRRIGLSLAEAAKKLAKSQLINTNYNTTFISYTLEEAISKIDYGRALYDSIPTRFKKKKMRDRRQSLEFSDPTTGTVQKLLSHAQRAPRGGGGSMVLDEFGHFQWAQKILDAALACILTGGGDMTMISTPNGEGDPFHEVGTNEKKHSHYSRHFVYWWDCRWLCNDVASARTRAPRMTTEERVTRYGTKTLKQVFESYVDLESFQQEMELKFLSSSYRYIPRSLVMTCIYPHLSRQFVDKSGQVVKFDPNAFDTEIEAGADIADKKWLDIDGQVQGSAYPIVNLYANDKEVNFFKCNSLAELFLTIRAGQINPMLFAGFDVGRTVNVSDLRILEEVNMSSDVNIQIERYSQQLANTPLPDQKRFLYDLLMKLPMMKLAIDAGGIGRGIAEDLQSFFPTRVTAIQFTAEWKAEAVKSIRSRIEKQLIAIAEDRITIEHITSIKRSISSNMLELFAADKREKHHGDAFWALAMASLLGTPVENIRGKMSFDSSRQVHGSLLFQGVIGQLVNAYVGGSRMVKGIPTAGLVIHPDSKGIFGIGPMPESVLQLPFPHSVF